MVYFILNSNIHYINTFFNSFPAQYIHNEKFSGIPCYVFQLKTTIEKKVNIYTLTVKQEDGVPMRYEMLGYDTLLGSHYDKYVVLYTSFVVAVPADDVFKIPSSMYKIYLFRTETNYARIRNFSFRRTRDAMWDRLTKRLSDHQFPRLSGIDIIVV